MNAQFQVAQLSGSTTSVGNAAPTRIFRLSKPLGDQAVVVNLGYDQKAKVDFSAIANEKITLVHVGDKLIILFDNKSMVTVEPFFDSRHDSLGNLTVEVAPGREVSVNEFASLFPITTDQSILPAAGEGGNAQGSGAYFSDSAVDPLGTRNPLDLLGQEELGNFRVNFDTAALMVNGTPRALANNAIVFDEDGLPGGLLGGIGDLDPGSNGPISATGILAHSYGSDGAGTTLLLAGTPPTGFIYTLSADRTVLTVSQFQNGVPVDVIRISLSNTTDGAYTIEQLHAIDHAPGNNENDQAFTFGYEVRDSNGDTAQGSLSLTVDDDSPVVGENASIVFDEDALPFGNLGGVGDLDPATNGPISATGTLAHSYGADGAGTTLLTAAGAPEGFTYAVNGNGTVLTVSQIQDGVNVTVLQVVLTDRITGDYTVTQLHAINHAPGQDENNQSFTFNYNVTDHDGDTAGGTLTLTVNDDTPIALSGTRGEGNEEGSGSFTFATVYEDGLTNLNSGNQSVGNAEGGFQTTSVVITASDLLGLVSFGADQPGSFSLNPGATAPTLFSHGDPVTYSVSNGTLTASAGGRTVFTLHDNGDQTFTFVLKDQLDHHGFGDYETLTINLASAFVATDSDGDSVVLNGTFNIRVENDVPVQNHSATVYGSVQEDALTNANSNHHSVGNPEGSGQTTVAEGELSVLVKVGADEAGTFSLDSAPGGLPSLTSKGGAVLYTVSGDTLTGYVEGGGGGGYQAGSDRAVFTLQITSSGHYKFTLLDQVDHLPNSPANNDSQTLTLNFGSAIKFTDSDGDSITLSGGLSISVEDDVPVLTGASIARTVDEDDIKTPWSQGTSPNDGSGDGSLTESSTGAAIVTGTLAGLVSTGADESGTFAFSADAIAKLTALGLFSKETAQGDGQNGKPLFYQISSSGPNEIVITGYEPNPHGNPVLSLTLNTVTGAYEFRLYDELIHVAGDGQNTDLRSGLSVDGIQASVPNIDFGSIITFTDRDGDQVTLSGKFTVTITDDVPHADIDIGRGSVTIDETPGNQADDTTSNSVRNLFANLEATFVNGARLVGDDPDVPGDNNGSNSGNGAIAYAHSNFAVVVDNSTIGSDSPPYPHQFTLSVTNGNGTPSGLFVTDGSPINLSMRDGLVIGTVVGGQFNGKVAFAIAIGADGEVSVAQYLSIRHDDRGDPNESNDNGSNHNDAPPDDPLTIQQTLDGKITATLTVTDSDGDQSSNSVNIGKLITFLDDGPSIDVKVVRDAQLVHDETPGIDASDNDAAGTTAFAGSTLASVFSAVDAPRGDDPHVTANPIGYALTTSPVFSITQNYGADGPAALKPVQYELVLSSNNVHSGLQTTDGRDIHLFKEGNLIVGRYEVGGNNTPDGSSDEVAAFAISIDPATGQLAMVQYVSLNHPNGGNPDDTVQLNDGTLSVRVTITDGDGDPASDTVDISCVIQFEDDGPTIVRSATLSIAVDEDGLATGNADAGRAGENPGTGSAIASGAAGALNALVNFGADGPGSAAFSLAVQSTRVDSGLDSNGSDVFIVSDGTTLRGYVNLGGNSGYQAGIDREVFTLTVGSNGSYTFTLKDQIDHPSLNGLNGDNTENLLASSIDLSKYIVATDGDGDSVKLGNGAFVVQIRDDIPTTTSNTLVRVDEDDLAAGNHDAAPGDDAASVSPVTGTLQFSVGADEPATVGFASLHSAAVVDAAGHPVTSGGQPLSYVWDLLTNTLYATPDGNPAHAAFKVSVNPSTGAYSFSLLGQIDHPGHDADGLNNGPETAYEDNININLTYTVTDRDGDSATGTLTVSIDDDMPILDSGAANNLVLNGSFEQGHGLGNNQWSIYHSLPGGWTTADLGPAGPNGDVPFEVQTGNVGGTFAQDGNALVELDSDLSGGNLSGGDHFNDSGHTNAILQQVVASTQAGQAYELTFWYAPRIGEGNADSGSMNVLWNGNVVKSIDSSGMTPGVWQQITVMVDGTGPNNVLGFQASGQENSLGAFIDNVSLVPVISVDEDGLTGPWSFGNHDSQPGDNFVADTDADGNEATATGNLNIQWGADSLDSGVDTVTSDATFKSFVQDHPDGLGDRSVTFTNTNVGVSGVAALSSHGDAVTFTLNADRTVLTGHAGSGPMLRDVIVISLSDEGSGQFRVVLLDQLDHAPGGNENDIGLKFNYTATDSDGDAVKGSFVVNVDDDMPTAVNDTPESVVEDGLSLVSGNVLTNDIAGADDPKSFVAWSGADAATIAALNTYGALTRNGDGTWSYQLDNSRAATQALTSASHLSFTLHYTMQDADGDQSSATLTIKIDGANDSASVMTAQVTGPDATVYEAGLNPSGSNAASTSETTAGSFTISATDGISDIVIGGVTFTLAQIQAFGTTNGVVNTGEGVLTLTNYSGTSFGGTVSYSYTLSATIDNDSKVPTGNDAVSGTGFDDSVALTVHGVGGTTAGDNLVIRAVDDMPTAVAGAALTVLETAGATTGINLLANDTKGADGAIVTAVDFGLGGGFQAIAANGTTTLTNVNGTYTFQADGTWTFDPSVNASNANTTGNFTYRITDGDGDNSTATQVVNITNANAAPTAGSQSITVDEDGLPNGIAASQPGDVAGNAITQTGTLIHNFNADGPAASDPINFSPMDNGSHTTLVGLSSGGVALKYYWDAAGDTLYASTNTTSLANAQSTAAFKVELNTTTGAYTYTQLKPVDHPGHDADGANNGPETSYEDNLGVNLTYQVKDSNGDTATGTLAVTINDDAPVANAEYATAKEQAVQDINAAFVLDFSGSIDNTELNQMLLAVKAAGDEIFANATGSVKIELIGFASTSVAAGPFTTQAAFDAQINAWNPSAGGTRPLSSSTDYSDAIQTLMSNYTPVAGQSNQVFFLSDGNPNENTGSGGQALNNTVRPLWNSFVNNATAPIAVTTIGIGNGIDTSNLQQVDVDGRGSPLTVAQFSDLIDTLVTAVGNNVVGNVLANGDGFGADGGRILSITFDNVTYSWNGATSIAKTDANTSAALGTINGTSISVDTALGGHFTFYFAPSGSHAAGEWVYSGPAELVANSSETFTYVLTDNDGDHASAALTVAVSAVNDAPVNTVPAAQSVAEDTNLVFSLGKLINVSDVDANGGNETVNLGVLHGTLTLASISGLTVTGNGTGSVVLTGSVANINAALNGLTYKGVQDYNGADTLTITTNDNGNTGSGGAKSDTDTVAITVTAVNDAPVITAPNGGNPASILVAENTTFVTDVNATDVDAGTTLTYSISGGADALKFTINPSTGVLSFVSAPNFEAPTDSGGNNVYDVIVRVSDGTLTDTQSISVTVTDANDPPVGVADHVYTNASSSGNGTTIALQNSWLVKNDTDMEGNPLNVATASNGNDVDQVNAGASTTSIRVDVARGDTGNFTYTATDGTSESGSTTVTVHRGNSDSTITGSSGNDILIGAGSTAATLDGGAGSDFVTGGSGADTLVADQNDYLLNGGGGNDTLRVSTSFTSTSDAQVVNIENVLLTTATSVNLANQTEGFTITGSSGADTIIGGAGADTITGGAGGDRMTGGSGAGVADTFVIGSGHTTLSIGGSGNNGTISGYDTITDFSLAVDKLSLNGTPFAASNTSGTNGTNSSLTIGGNEVSSHAITNGIIRFDDSSTFSSALTLDSTQDVAAVVDYLRHNDLGNAGATVAFTATIGGVNHTYIYQQVGNSQSDTNDILVDLENVTLTSGGTSLATLIGNGHVDPIVLDLGAQGISFSSIGDGVQFDINADGAHDQVAWTANGQDGILAMDLDGSGKIEGGKELFTPNFNGGHFADGIAALASLDGNHDGVIDSQDQAFGDLVVWRDANHNGVSETGELAKLADLGITSISLNTTPGGAPIDGQHIAGTGSFTYADGSTGTFVEVDLDASLGTTPAQPDSHPADAHDLSAFAAVAAEIDHGGGDIDLSALQQPGTDHAPAPQGQGAEAPHLAADAGATTPAAIAIMHEQAALAMQLAAS